MERSGVRFSVKGIFMLQLLQQQYHPECGKLYFLLILVEFKIKKKKKKKEIKEEKKKDKKVAYTRIQ